MRMTMSMSWDSILIQANLPETWAISAGCVALVIGLAWLIHRKQARKQASAAFEQGLQHQAAVQAQERLAFEDQLQTSQLRLAELGESRAADAATIQGLRSQLESLQSDSNNKRDELSAAMAEVAATTARLEEAKKGFDEKEQLFRDSSAMLKQEFELLATKVFESQGAKHEANLKTVLTPFKDQIVDFKKRVEEVYHTETKERASLLTEIKNLQSASERINEEATNLTRALKGDKKLQGNWGELVLERVLEESGLRRDHEYFVQATRRDAKGDIKRPDVLIRLPENKDVVVDAKVSLVAYEEAIACEDEDARDRAVKTHLLHLRNHVKRLSEQDYDQLKDVRSLDFVLMFIPIESAFTLAMEMDQRLFTEAFAKRIVLVSPTTLMMTLRIINNVWRYEKQNRNAQEIARRAGALYDKLRGLVDDMDKLGKQMETAEKTYQSVVAKMSTGKGNLVRQVEAFRELGAQVKTPMSKEVLEAAQSDAIEQIPPHEG
ncbi:MAG: DNA recombination protein RmuC [Pseudomonadota bacterium]